MSRRDSVTRQQMVRISLKTWILLQRLQLKQSIEREHKPTLASILDGMIEREARRAGLEVA